MTSTHRAADGTVRQDHYSDGEQPWDVIVRLGWGPQFAAGNVLKYLRRTKEPEHSLESARWYWARLQEMSLAELDVTERSATSALSMLIKELTEEQQWLLCRTVE